MTEQEKQLLDEAGFVVLENFIEADLLAGLRVRVQQLFEVEGDGAGSEFKQEAGCRRLANLVDKGEIFREIIALPRLQAYVVQVLGSAFKLSSVNARAVDSNAGITQPLHADMAAVADARGYWVCNTVWMLDDFTASNGAIRAVPGSHRWGRLPQDVLTEPTAPHPQEVCVTGAAGSVVVMNAHLWHGGTANRSPRPRTAVHVFFTRRDKPQQQYQKRLLRPEVQQALSPALRELLALDDPLNDALSADVRPRSGFMR